MEKNQALLRALHSTIEMSQSAAIEPELVNEIAANLGFSTHDMARLAEQWKKDGLIDLHWGAKLSLTQAGRNLAIGAATPGMHLGEGAILVQGSIGPGAVVGKGAMGHGAVRIEVSEERIGDLVAVLASLRRMEKQLGLEGQETAQALEGQIQGIIQEASKAEPDKTSLKDKLDQANELAEKLGKLSDTASKLKPILVPLKTGLLWLATHFLGIGL